MANRSAWVIISRFFLGSQHEFGGAQRSGPPRAAASKSLEIFFGWLRIAEPGRGLGLFRLITGMRTIGARTRRKVE
jgi:hypothetical protein